jgi:hypothetical protein
MTFVFGTNVEQVEKIYKLHDRHYYNITRKLFQPMYTATDKV